MQGENRGKGKNNWLENNENWANPRKTMAVAQVTGTWKQDQRALRECGQDCRSCGRLTLVLRLHPHDTCLWTTPGPSLWKAVKLMKNLQVLESRFLPWLHTLPNRDVAGKTVLFVNLGQMSRKPTQTVSCHERRACWRGDARSATQIGNRNTPAALPVGLHQKVRRQLQELVVLYIQDLHRGPFQPLREPRQLVVSRQ